MVGHIDIIEILLHKEIVKTDLARIDIQIADELSEVRSHHFVKDPLPRRNVDRFLD